MLYTSERNFGCRFLEIEIFSYRSIILENEKIRTTLLLDKGTEIIEFNFKESDTDFIWRSPQGLSCLKKIQFARKDEHILTDGYTGAWFECFPNLGEACVYKGAYIPHYGEVCYLPWEYTVIKDEPGEVAIKCFVKTTKTPYSIEKTFTIKSGEPTLYIEETITNTGGVDLHYQWGYHPNLGSNIIDGDSFIDLPGGEAQIHYSSPGSRFEVNMEGMWPYIKGKNGMEIDLRRIQPENSGIDEVWNVKNLKAGWTSVFNPKKNLGLELSWDLNAFGHNSIWHVCNGDDSYPRYGKTYVLGLMPRNDIEWGLEKSAQSGNCPIIKQGETKTAWLKASVIRKRP
jgi:hypothetical protein